MPKAGTGKSTLVRFIIGALNVKEDKVCYATYTGKAANVLLKKGNKNVTTLHKLLYQSYLKSDGKYGRRVVKFIPYKIVIVDEVSMVPKEMLQLLATFPVHIICLGDPGQLEPIIKDSNNYVLNSPHIFLDEVMRQAQESEIVRLSMAIREGKPIKKTRGNEVIILDSKELNTGMLEWADQILCAKNATRIYINKLMRQMKNLNPYEPQDGDKIICSDNYWGILSEKEQEPLINGTIGYLKNSFNTFFRYPNYIHRGDVPILNGTIEIEDGDCFTSLDMDKNLIISGEATIDRKALYKILNNKKCADLIPIEMNYGYAITVHRAQGSEWNKVLVIEENFPFSKEEHIRWLYTACTRPSEKLVLVKKG